MTCIKGILIISLIFSNLLFSMGELSLSQENQIDDFIIENYLMSCIEGKPESVEYFLNHPSNQATRFLQKTTTKKGETGFILAAQRGHSATLKAMRSNHSLEEKKKKDSKNLSALAWAKKNNHCSCVQLIRKDISHYRQSLKKYSNR